MARAMDVVEYDESWPEQYRREEALLQGIFGDRLVSIHHIGSTAVPGLCAKPIVDILVFVKEIETIDDLNPEMERSGYMARGENCVPGRRYYVKRSKDGNHTHHVHVYGQAYGESSKEIRFRDALRRNPRLARQYAELKRGLSKAYYTDPKAYTDGKTVFVQHALRRDIAEAVLGRCVTVAIEGSATPGDSSVRRGVARGYGEGREVYLMGEGGYCQGGCTGNIVAVILRDDGEDIWVAAPQGARPHQAEIEAAMRLTEPGLRAVYVCQYEKSCGVILYRKNGPAIEYLILFQHGSKTWSFPKGHAEPFETEHETAIREVREETGLEARLLPDFQECASYPIRTNGEKKIVLYLAEAKGLLRIPSGEIERFTWVNRAEALRFLPASRYEGILEKAETRIHSEGAGDSR